MNSIGQRALQNPIIRRMRRHTAMPTLFRSPGSGPAQAPAGQPMIQVPRSRAQAPAGVVRAELLPPSASLPIGHVIGLPPASAEPGPTAGHLAKRQAAPPPPGRPVPARAPETRPPPATLSETEPDANDGVWQRLQAIFRKHEEKEATAQTTTPPERESTPPRRPGRAEAPPATQVQRERSPRPIKRADAPPARRPGSEPASTRSRPTAESRAAAGPRPGDAAPAQEPLGEQTIDEPGADQPVAVPEPPVSAAPDQPSRAEATVAQAPHAEDSDLESADEVELETLPRSTGPEATGPAEPTTSLPLQAVWAVQQLGEPSTPPSPEPAIIPEADSRPESEAESPPATREEIPKEEGKPPAREQVGRPSGGATAPGQPTDSSIEIIPPRQPRPETFQAEQPIRLAASEGVPPAPGKAVPPEFAGKQSRAEPTRVQSPREGFAAGTSTVQMRRDGELDRAPVQPLDKGPGEPELVQTEIGPLPADLWHLIGESPPRRPPPEAAPSRPGPVTEDREATVERAVAAAEAPSAPFAPPRPEQPAAQGSAATLIQRRPDEASGETGEAAVPETETAAASGEGGAAEEPDVDELARRVYAEIKRRFSVEWERARQRG